MEIYKRFTWAIIPLNTPLFKKKCSKCRNSNLYYSSDKFRLNSQKKSIDVWLIYRCVKCDYTCNITLFSRTKPELIDKELYQKLSMNDCETAWKYAFDTAIFRRNSMEIDFSDVKYDIIYDHPTLDEIALITADGIEFEVRAKYEFDLKLATVIKRCLDISSTQLKKLLDNGIISSSSPTSPKKCKVRDGIKVYIDIRKLKDYLEKIV